MDKEDIQEISQKIFHDMGHVVEEALTSPSHINRTIGEAMRHIGATLVVNSNNYLPVRRDEILVEPARLSTKHNDAVVLINRTCTTPNSFTVLAHVTTKENKQNYELFVYSVDHFNLHLSKFISLKQEMGNEIIRQLSSLLPKDGAMLVHCVLLKNYFQEEQPQSTDENALFSPDVEQPVFSGKPSFPLESAPPSSGPSLPPVSDDALL